MRAALVVLALLTLGEIRLFDRLLYDGHDDASFVVESVRGVLDGRPVSKSWQQRLLGPLVVQAVARVSGSPLTALRVVGGFFVAIANFLLFGLFRRRGASAKM